MNSDNVADFEDMNVFKKTMSFFRDYAKCAVYNRVAMAGYIVWGVYLSYDPLVARGFSDDENFLIKLGILGTASFLSAVTVGGFHTLDSYRRTKKIISSGKMNESLSSKKGKAYCDYRGIKLAMKESGIDYVVSNEEFY